ncbi:MAG TPA: CBS domain-containing protein [Nocardioides sp.]|jgi:CBS-domain-containing membrane protein|nr:CBS domain-containing protein [Nocardioides sp.]
MLVRDLMSSPAVTIGPSDAVARAAQVLDRLGLTSLPVVDHERRLLGVIGEVEVIRAVAVEDRREAGDRPRVADASVRDVMSCDVPTADADDDLADVIAGLRERGVKSLPVLLHGRVVGMISRRDVVHAMVDEGLREHPSPELAPA